MRLFLSGKKKFHQVVNLTNTPIIKCFLNTFTISLAQSKQSRIYSKFFSNETALGYHSTLTFLRKKSAPPMEIQFIKEFILYLKNSRKIIIT